MIKISLKKSENSFYCPKFRFVENWNPNLEMLLVSEEEE